MTRLLFITPKIDERHDDLAFASLWARAFSDAGYAVTVVCTAKGETGLTLPVLSLGGEHGAPRWLQVLRFWRILLTTPHDRAFVHMTPRWLFAGCWFWWLKRIPCYLWFTHYTNTLSLKVGSRVAKRMFAATKECLPHYDGNPKKVVTGHGIDTTFWDLPELSETEREPATQLLAVHRISRSKRLEIVLKALALLPPEYRLTHYGRPQDPRFDPTYQQEIESLIGTLGLRDRVELKGSIPMRNLRSVYPRYRVFINMVPQTIDKTVLEAMYSGLTPVMTRGQADAIGYPDAPADDTPEAVAAYIRGMSLMPRDQVRKIVDDGHSLKSLIDKMSVYIQPGT
ncbi:glycosyltransferase [Patescibacteria group bacterium]|nr:glycosyltransferase [Patescibacteria group bacterium]MBU1448559.1 glycosyltransferase [Patescibacteria group bacterium]MBU2613193.1 glycosyltransferase [Patescibacteria group bacterium]